MSSQACRPDVVEKLVQGALQGMLSSVDNCSANEVLSAYFTMLKRGIRLTIASNPGPFTRTSLQHTIMELLAECADPAGKN